MRNLFIAYLLFFMLLVVGGSRATACVNLDINVGALDSAEGRLFAEIVSTFIHERTGTKSIIKLYSDSDALRDALLEKKIELVIARLDDRGGEGGAFAARYQALKDDYKERMDLILLEPLVKTEESGGQLTGIIAPALATIVLEKFPALPRLLKKLAGKINMTTKNNLLELVSAKGEKPSRIAKDFLVKNRLI